MLPYDDMSKHICYDNEIIILSAASGESYFALVYVVVIALLL